VDFWGTYISVLLVVGMIWFLGWVISKQWYKSRFVAYGQMQAQLLEKFARELPLEDISRLPMKPGEEFVYELKDATLVETRAGARTSTRTFGAATFRVAQGVYLTGGGGKSYSPPAEEEMTAIDHGRATFTNKRVVFVGSKHTREWDFAKLLGATEVPGAGVLMAVSSRQKMSGVMPGNRQTLTPWILFQISQTIADEGFEAAREPLRQAARDAREQVAWVEAHPYASKEAILEFSTEQQARLLPDEPASEESTEPQVHTRLSAATTDRRPPKGKVPTELEVVGEFFYQDSFEALRKEFGTRGDSEHIVEAELRNDPDNPHSESGMAVAVFIRGHQVGHIPEALAPDVFEALEKKGGTATLGARLWLDDENSKPGKSSVQLFLDSRLGL